MKLTKIGGVYHAVIQSSGKRRTISTRCTDKRQAEKVVAESSIAELEVAAKAGRLTAEAIGRIVSGKRLSMKGCVEQFEQWMRARGRSPKTVDNNLTTVMAWVRDMDLASVSPHNIQEHHIADWVNRKEQTKASTRTVALASIRTFFGFLTAKGWSVGDPSQGVEVSHEGLTHEQQEAEPRQPFTDEELTRLREHIRVERSDAASTYAKTEPNKGPMPHHAAKAYERMAWLDFWNCAVQIASETGMRLGDIATLEWKSFETPGRLIRHTKKTRQRINVPISDDVIALITCIPATHGQFIFPTQAEIAQDVKRRSLLSVQFNRLCTAAGITGKSFHCIRHTVATEKFNASNKEELAKRLAEVLSVKEISALLGHTNSKTTKNYVH